MLEMKNVSIKKDKRVLIKNINLTFEDKLIYGLVGINGSGKTMILKALAGFQKLSGGTVYQDGNLILNGKRTILNAGLVLGEQEFISYFTLEENLELIKSICPNKNNIHLEYWIDLYQVDKYRNIQYKNLSLGTKKKMVLIQAFMDYPRILILDEPMNALDEKSVSVTKEVLKKHREKGLVIMTSHYKSDIDDLCDVIYHVEEGEISYLND